MEPNRIHHAAHTHPAQSYQGKGYKLPHGLTVKELKDMTSARLAAEARQKEMLDSNVHHGPSLAHSSSSVSSTHTHRSKNSVGLVLERSSIDQVTSSHNLISSHVQKFHGFSENVSTGRNVSMLPSSGSSGNLRTHSSLGLMPHNNRPFQPDRTHLDFERNHENPVQHSVDLNNHFNVNYRNYPASQLHSASSNNHYICHDISRSNSYPVPNAIANQSFAFSGSSIPETIGAFIPLNRPSMNVEHSSIPSSLSQEKSLFVPVVTYGESYLAGSSVASRGSSPTDSKTDDRSSLITENGWLDIFGRPSSAATIPTIIPSSESFCPEDDIYTVTLSPEHAKFAHSLSPDERGMSSFSPNSKPFRVTDFRVEGQNMSNPMKAMPMSGVFRSLPSDPYDHRPVLSDSASFHAFSPLRTGSDVANDSMVKSWTNSFAEDYEDAPKDEEDELALNRLEHDLNALLTIGHEPSALLKNDFLVSKIDPVFNPPQSNVPVESPTETGEVLPTPSKKSSTARKSFNRHRHRQAKKKDHAFNG